MCFELPCVGHNVRLLNDYSTPDGIEIPEGMEGVIEREYLEEREIEVKFRFDDDSSVNARLSENDVVSVETEMA